VSHLFPGSKNPDDWKAIRGYLSAKAKDFDKLIERLELEYKNDYKGENVCRMLNILRSSPFCKGNWDKFEVWPAA
jgi:hypothetical protein